MKVQVTTHAKNEHKNVADKRNKNIPPLPATELQEGSRVQAQKPREISGTRTENLLPDGARAVCLIPACGVAAEQHLIGCPKFGAKYNNPPELQVLLNSEVGIKARFSLP